MIKVALVFSSFESHLAFCFSSFSRLFWFSSLLSLFHRRRILGTLISKNLISFLVSQRFRRFERPFFSYLPRRGWRRAAKTDAIKARLKLNNFSYEIVHVVFFFFVLSSVFSEFFRQFLSSQFGEIQAHFLVVLSFGFQSLIIKIGPASVFIRQKRW